MAKIDEIKEHITTLRAYLNIVVAIILALGAGISKLYLSHSTGTLFWLGSVFIIVLIVLFIFISKNIHKNIKKLKDL
jgi:ABC-type siderophore export system fused ATPase/permease subunit